MITLSIAATSLRRLFRDRTAMFFVVALPIAVIVILGVTLTGFDTFRVGLVVDDPGPLAHQLAAITRAAPALRVRGFADRAHADTAVRRGEIDGVLVVPAGYDAALRAGGRAEVDLVSMRQSANGPALASAVAAVVAAQAADVQAAHFATREAGGSFEANLRVVQGVRQAVPPIAVRTQLVHAGASKLPQGFGYSAPTMLVLMVFINALANGAAVIRTRGLGIYSRALSAPVPVRSIVLAETLAYLSLSLMQSAMIVAIGALAFGVHWGNPVGAGMLIVLWSLVGTGAGVLSGTLFRTPEQAASIGPAVGIAFGMLGGCMWPLAIVGRTMRDVGHLVPHAWAIDAWTALLSRNAGPAGILPQLGILSGYAVALLTVAVIRLRRRITA